MNFANYRQNLHHPLAKSSRMMVMFHRGLILAVRCGALGDLVQFSGAVAALADHHDQPIDVLTGGGPGAELLADMPEVGRTFTVNHRRRPAWLAPDLVELGRVLAARRYAHVYMGDSVPVIEELLAAAGAHIHPLHLPTSVPHALDGYASALDVYGIEHPAVLNPCIPRREADQQEARKLLAAHGVSQEPVIVIQMGNARSMHPLAALRPQRNLKAWGIEAWVATLTALGDLHPGTTLALAGAPAEWEANEAVRQRLPALLKARTVNLARDLPILRLRGLLTEALGCLSVDTGPAHLAAAVGCPLVVLFGPADPTQMAPRGPGPVRVVTSGIGCSPCYGSPRRDACRSNRCMQQITVGQVLGAWQSLAGDQQAVA